MYMHMKKRTVLLVLCVAGTMGAYQIKLENHTNRLLSACAYFRGVSDFEATQIGPYESGIIHSGSDGYFLYRLRIDALGRYEEFDTKAGKRVDFLQNKQQGLYSWSGLKRGDLAADIFDSSIGLEVNFK
jgi:hypothetical protein